MASTIRNLTLEVGAVNVTVSLRGASERKDVSFDRATTAGNPIKRIETDSIKGAVEVEVERTVEVPPTGRQKKSRTEVVKEKVLAYLPIDGEIKGVRDGDEFFEITPEEIEQIDALTKLDAITINEFIPAAEVPWERAQACYFLAPPKGQGAKILATLRDAMTNKGVVGVAKLMPKSRQKLCIVYPRHGGLMVTCLAYSDTFAQVTDGTAAISGVEVNPKVLELTETLISAMTTDVSVLDEYRDDLIDLKADLIERAKLGKPLTDEEAEDMEGKEATPLPARPADSIDTLTERLTESVSLAKKARQHKAPSREKVTA